MNMKPRNVEAAAKLIITSIAIPKKKKKRDIHSKKLTKPTLYLYFYFYFMYRVLI